MILPWLQIPPGRRAPFLLVLAGNPAMRHRAGIAGNESCNPPNPNARIAEREVGSARERGTGARFFTGIQRLAGWTGRNSGPTRHPRGGRSSGSRDRPTGGQWRAFGRVTDPEGKPMAGVEVWAHCGIGTLRKTGIATSGADGRYELNFQPGWGSSNPTAIEAATISAHKPGISSRT